MIYEFSDLKLDLDRHLLTRGGQPIKLTKLSFKALLALVQAAPALISHDKLIDQIWGPNRVITPDNLSQRMKTLRQSLGDDPNQPIYIEGVRGKGYRLVPEAKIQSASTSSRSFKRGLSSRLLVSLVVLALALGYIALDKFVLGPVEDEKLARSAHQAGRSEALTESFGDKSIAVMPFANLSPESSNQFFADGIHDDLLTRISNIKNIKTISRTSVMTYRGTNKKLGTIAKELGVNTILEGGVQRAGDQVRINLQLIDAETDAHLWAQSFTRELTATNVFAVQSEITEAILGALKVFLSADERSRVEKQPTANLEALEAYFKGGELIHLATTSGLEQAIEAYQLAIRLDPGFALAYSAQALALLSQVIYSGFPTQAQLEKSRLLIDQAILLDPQSSEAFRALGQWYRFSGDIDKAEKALDQALALGPNNAAAYANYGSLREKDRADPAAAFSLYKRAAELDPQNIGIKTKLAKLMSYLSLAKDAISMLENDLAGHPYYAYGHRTLAQLYSLDESRHDKAVKALRRAYELDPQNPQIAVWNAVMHWRLGDYENTALWMNHAARLSPGSDEAPVYRGWAYINRADFESARQVLNHSVSRTQLYWIAVFTLARVDMAAGHPEKAIDRYMDFIPESDSAKLETVVSFGAGVIHAYLSLGEQEKARAMEAKLMSVFAASPKVNYHTSAIMSTSLYSALGQKETAIASLTEWVNQGGVSAFLQEQTGFELKGLASDPRYQEILQTVDNRLSEQKANLALWEASGEMPHMPREVTDPR